MCYCMTKKVSVFLDWDPLGSGTTIPEAVLSTYLLPFLLDTCSSISELEEAARCELEQNAHDIESERKVGSIGAGRNARIILTERSTASTEAEHYSRKDCCCQQ